MNNLAASYRAAGQTDKALKLFREALALNQKLLELNTVELGPEHPTTLNNLNAVTLSMRAYTRTLAIVEYRMGNFKEAITAANNSLELAMKELKLPSSPYDLAILSMSHFKTGEQGKANEYREKLLEAMELDAYKDNAGHKSFAHEVEELFSSANNDEDDPSPPSEKESE